jgi:predicted tellurium resistance membrane protein TerC
LLTDQADHDLDGKIAEKSNLMGAIQTIIVADFVMSLDNALAIAAARQRKHVSGDFRIGA